MKRVIALLTLAALSVFGTAVSSADPGWVVLGRGMANGFFPRVNMSASTNSTPDRVKVTLEGSMKAVVRWVIECQARSEPTSGNDPAPVVYEEGQKRLAPGESKEIAPPADASTCYRVYADASSTPRATRRLRRVVLIVEAKWPESAENKQN